MQLVIVESPTKARTLSRFLGKEYRIEATLGHIRDLPKKKFGVDINHDFAPEYEIVRDKQRVVSMLKRLAGDADSVVLATDPDREGEAIAYHVAALLGGKSQIPPRLRSGRANSKFARVVFHEITQHAIAEAFKNPRGIDMYLVNAQQARRVLDRIVGYKLSPLLWKKIGKRWLSAGRVQSIAVRLIVERERERERFTAEEFWRIMGRFQPSQRKHAAFAAELVAKKGKKYEIKQEHTLFDGSYTVTKTTITSERSVQKIIADFVPPWTVTAVDKKKITRTPPPPFTTSTLQQTAHRALGFSSKRTMSVAQRLYEQGFITYHRTDSVALSDKFLSAAKAYITKQYGASYALDKPRRYKAKARLAQEAHEGIRPTTIVTVNLHRSTDNKNFNRDHARLYELIWKRAVASQAAPAVFDATTICITDASKHEFQTSGSVIRFDGYLAITGRSHEDQLLPAVAVGDRLDLLEAMPEQKFTDPPPRYSEAKLIRSLEEHGIGRPSTYAPIISTIADRQYVERNESRQFVPTELGMTVNDFLVEHFADIVTLPFTARVEDELDAIAHKGADWVAVLRNFYEPFAKVLARTDQQAKKVTMPVEVIDEQCPTCGKQLVIRTGRYGKFISCSGFPECTFTKNVVEKIGLSCPQCSSGEVIIKKTRKGKTFYGCSRYPDCDFASWTKPK